MPFQIALNLTLKQRVLGFMTLLGIIPILAFGLTAYSMWKGNEVDVAFERANAGAISLTDINAQVYAVVMESRGIYMSKTWAEAKPYAEGLERQLARMQAIVASWKSNNGIESERQSIEALEKSVDQFAALRRELIVRAKAEDLAGARALGDNEANRVMRKAMNSLINDLGDRYKAHRAHADALKEDVERTNLRFLIVLAVSAMLIGGFGAFSLQRTVISLFSRVRLVMMKLAAGDLTAEFEGAERKDEVGDFARALQKFKDDAHSRAQMEAVARAQAERTEAERARAAAAQAETAAQQAHAIAAVAQALDRLADGDLASGIETSVAPDFEGLKVDFNRTVDKLRTTLRMVADTSGIIASSTQQITTAAGDLSARTEKQAATLEQTAAALDEITATVSKTSEGASRAQDMAATTKRSADIAADVVRKAVSAVGGIEKSSQQISQIIGVIDEIAFQTNLLALNAGVEAARAGESGRGFAVVASEVRALAQRSANAAKQIKTLISASTAQVAEGVTFVGETGRSLTEIQGHVNEIAKIIADIATAAREQATGLSEVNTAVNQMDQVTQQNAAMVQQTNDASRSLSERTHQMAQLVASFRLGRSEERGASAPQAVPRRSATARRNVVGATALKPAPDWQDF